jgi:hypothetical protein
MGLTMKTTLLAATALPGATHFASVLAHPSSGMGPGGKVLRHPVNKDNTPGVGLMTSEERNAHRDRMRVRGFSK